VIPHRWIRDNRAAARPIEATQRLFQNIKKRLPKLWTVRWMGNHKMADAIPRKADLVARVFETLEHL
jgi:hypothetical protein